MSLFCDEDQYSNQEEVEEAFPAAVMVVPVEHGWMVFFFWDEYETWTRQL